MGRAHIEAKSSMSSEIFVKEDHIFLLSQLVDCSSLIRPLNLCLEPGPGDKVERSWWA